MSRMRDDVMTDADVAVIAAKENLASLQRRAGYAAAMRAPKPRWTATIACLVTAVAFAALAYATWFDIAADWLRWIVVLVFGGFAGAMLLAAFGLSPGLDTSRRWGAAILDKHMTGDTRELSILTEDGAQHRLPVDAELHEALRAGDVGVAVVNKTEPFELTKFIRL